MRGIFFILVSLMMIHPVDLPSQKEGDQWVIGYWEGGHPDHSIMFCDFRSGYLDLKWMRDIRIRMTETDAGICGADGEPLIWANGMQIMGSGGISIADTIAYEPYFDPLNPFRVPYWDYYLASGRPTGFPKHDGALILPVPGLENEYVVFYHTGEWHPIGYYAVTKHLEARIRWEEDHSFTLLYKDRLVGPYQNWYTDNLEAVRHANGRDWWIMAFEQETDRFYAYLLDTSGLHRHHEGVTDMPVRDGLGQSAFSNNGDYLARMDAISLSEGQYITLYSFDRCAGVLERMATFHNQLGYSFFTGVAFSPSDRYLYANDNNRLWQWDLWAGDIAASQTLVDTFDGFVDPEWFGTRFGPIMSAPDGRIYVVPPGGGSRYLHVIDRPDMPAAESKFLQHHIYLQTWNARSGPNIPNFRLGPLDGSPCDTLGLDNHPVARWRYEADAPDWLFTIRFTDLSFYEPEIWHWDFGDGATSDEVHPVHVFEPGYYKVCLTVSNSFSSDSSCQWVEILTTSLQEERNREPDLSISPNPFKDELIIRSRSGLIRSAHLQLYDMHGRRVMDEPQAPVPVTIRMPSLPPGMYLCVITEQDREEYVFKVMKL